MGIIVNLSDFKGSYSIATDVYTTAELEAYIEEREKQILIQLLGKVLFDLFEADLVAGIPQTARFVKIFNALFEVINDEEVDSEGMVVMVAKFIYAGFAAEQSQNNSIAGNSQSQSTINSPSTISHNTIMFRFNEAQKSYASIQYYIDENLVDYLGYNGRIQTPMSWA
jgi:hypothetical protein